MDYQHPHHHHQPLHQHQSDDERLYFEVAKIRARIKSREGVNVDAIRHKSHQPSPSSHSQSLQFHNHNSTNKAQPRQIDEKLILNILQRIRAKRNGADISAIPYTPPKYTPPPRERNVLAERIVTYFTNEATQTEDGFSHNASSISTSSPPHRHRHIEDESVIEGIVEDFDDPPPHVSDTHRRSPTLSYSNHNNPPQHFSDSQRRSPTLTYSHHSNPHASDSQRRSPTLTHSPHKPRNHSSHSQPTFTPSQSSSSNNRRSPPTNIPYRPPPSSAKPRPQTQPPPVHSNFDPDNENIFFSSPQQSPNRTSPRIPKLLFRSFNESFEHSGDDESRVIDMNEYRLTSDRIQKFRVAMSPSENKLFTAPSALNDGLVGAGSPICVEWPPTSQNTYKSALSMTNLHHVTPYPLPPSANTSPIPDRRPASSMGFSSHQNDHHFHHTNNSNNNRHSLTFGAPASAPYSNTYDDHAEQDEEVHFMEDDQEDEESFIRRVEQFISDSSMYDLSSSVTKARRHSLQLQLQQQPHQPLSHIQPNATPPPPSTSQPSSQRKSVMQTIPSGQVVNNFSDSPSKPTLDIVETPAPKPTPKPALILAQHSTEELIQAVTDGAEMNKVNRRAAPEKRYFRVVAASNEFPHLVWSKSFDSKASNSISLRDVINVHFGVPSAKLLQSAKKMRPGDLAARVFSIVTKQRTLEILADSVDQRKLWVDALTYMYKNIGSATKALQGRPPSKNRSSTPQPSSGRKSPFRFLSRSKTPDF